MPRSRGCLPARHGPDMENLALSGRRSQKASSLRSPGQPFRSSLWDLGVSLKRQRFDEAEPKDSMKVLASLRRQGRLGHPEDVRIAMQSLGDVRLWREALSLLRGRLRAPYQPTPRMYSVAIKLCQHWQQAVSVLEEAKSGNGLLDAGVVNSVISMFKNGQWERALSLLNSMPEMNVHPDEISFNAVISACANSGKWELTLDLLEAMWDESASPNIISYNTALWACSKSQRWEWGLFLLRETWLSGVPATLVTYNAAISACRSKQWETALWLLEDSIGNELMPNRPTYTTAIRACAQAGKWEHSLRLFNDMASRWTPPDVVAYNAAITSCARGQQWRLSLGLLEDMKLDGLRPDFVTFGALVSSYGRSRQWEKALHELASLEDRWGGPDMVGRGAVIDACGKSQEWDTALWLFSEFDQRRKTPDTIVLNAAIAACKASQRWEQALHMLSNAPKRPGCCADVTSFNTVMSACEGAGEWRWALAMLGRMGETHLSPDATSYAAAASACRSAGLWQHVLQLLQEAIARDVQVDAPLCGLVLKACRQAGSWHSGLRLLCQLDSRKRCGDSIVTYGEAASASELGLQGALARRWLQRVERLSSELLSSDALGAAGMNGPLHAALAQDLLQEHGLLSHQECRAFSRRMLTPVVVQLHKLIGIPRAQAALSHREFASGDSLRTIRNSYSYIQDYDNGCGDTQVLYRRLDYVTWPKAVQRYKRMFSKTPKLPTQQEALNGRLHDEVLELQVSLGGRATATALWKVGLCPSKPWSWEALARRAARGALAAEGCHPQDDAGKDKLLTWLSVQLMRAAPQTRHADFEICALEPKRDVGNKQVVGWGHIGAHGGDLVNSQDLLPVFVDYSAEPHSERQALLLALRQVRSLNAPTAGRGDESRKDDGVNT
eukprot:TRINITY_DN49425_c0_g1_i1.p1 TRINITY_DN49425_c0_g1~~TRINITY_DN49425_c0_g1_i1.p1  ORF type:complete len:897 (-),score=164.31 TRINITY_DN49425_c0_g1_i1:53-2743(-)